ncbi:MAG: DUF1080 domain-containing protein [Candidatus Solibacter usitatus]|nr:DUF1080 domain-containing protein [Candidatus Solibacter usitatus]
MRPTWRNSVNFSFSSALILTALLLPAQEPNALERDPKSWIDITPGPRLVGWTRLNIAPDPLDPVSQWSLLPGGGVLCEGNRGHEWLRYDKPLDDFVFHVEFRYTRLEGTPRYNSGVFVRTPPDYSFWNQLQIGASAGGHFFGYTLVDGARRRFDLSPRLVDQRVKPAGEWNTLEITARGPVLSAWVNGAVVSEYKYCTLPSGHLGLEAEGFRIEFRNLKLRLLTAAPIQ